MKLQDFGHWAIATILVTASASSKDSHDDSFSSAVRSTSFSNWNLNGTFQRVTSMNGGQCVMSDQGFAGPLAPLDDEVSFHVRGPVHLKQFAHYTLMSGPSKREVGSNILRRHSFHERRHHHHHSYPESNDFDKRSTSACGCGAVISAIGQGWWMTDTWDCSTSSLSSSTTFTITPSSPPSSTASTSSFSPSYTPQSSAPGIWTRAAYYSSSNQQSTGLTFLANHGGAGSGVFDYTFGASLSYVNPTGTICASSPQILADTIIPDAHEITIMSANPCGVNGDLTSCGYYRPGSVAYHGFGGGSGGSTGSSSASSSQLFLLEFSMPHSSPSSLSSGGGFQADTPAIWLLNAQIPRTGQYSSCSCWSSGCGEWDLFEVLEAGDDKATVTFHGSAPGKGYMFPDYFQRPVNGSVKVAVVFDAEAQSGTIRVLGDGMRFDESIERDVVSGWAGASAGSNGGSTGIARLGVGFGNVVDLAMALGDG